MAFDISVALTWILFLAMFPIAFFWLRRAWRIAVRRDFSEVALKGGLPPCERGEMGKVRIGDQRHRRRRDRVRDFRGRRGRHALRDLDSHRRQHHLVQVLRQLRTRPARARIRKEGQGEGLIVRSGLLRQRLVGLFALGLLLFNFPLLAVWDRDLLFFGLPLFPTALFLAWALLIAALAWLLERAGD